MNPTEVSIPSIDSMPLPSMPIRRDTLSMPPPSMPIRRDTSSMPPPSMPIRRDMSSMPPSSLPIRRDTSGMLPPDMPPRRVHIPTPHFDATMQRCLTKLRKCTSSTKPSDSSQSNKNPSPAIS
ncbi:hypothetical protein BDB01DRAFT_847679 [Pilobolus umbonatus]|nr:hypothetical protein BDB01DRAFT_847679 [Pilobolus umbonatus]